MPVEIPENVLDQIGYLCKKIWDIEWSGVIFYKTEGQFATPTFKCILEDFFLMHIGNEVFTSYLFNEQLSRYMTKHPHLLEYRIGHMHSHHNMGVFFSPEDQGELRNNAGNHNFYLSVIVNNREDIIARVAFMAKRINAVSDVLTYMNEEGKPVSVSLEGTQRETNEFYSFDCHIRKAAHSVSTEFEERYKQVLTLKQQENSAPSLSEASGGVLSGMELEESHFFMGTDDHGKTPGRHLNRRTGIKGQNSADCIESFMVKLFADSADEERDLVSYLAELNTLQEFGEGSVTLLADQINNNAAQYYLLCFPNDPEMFALHATMEECVAHLKDLQFDYEVAQVLAGYFKDFLNAEIYANDNPSFGK